MKDIISETFTKLGLKFERFDEKERTIFQLGMALDNGKSDCIIDINETTDKILIYFYLPSTFPKNKRNLAAEYITRVNFDLLIGNFDLDYNDGEVRYRCSYVYDKYSDTHEELAFLRYFIASCKKMDKHLPGFMSLIYSNVTPQDALMYVENAVNPAAN